MSVRFGYTLQEVIEAISQLARGRSNSSGDITLTDASATTTLKNAAIQVGDVVDLVPQSADAAAEVPFLYVTPATTKGQLTLTHSNVTLTRKFRYRVRE